MQERIKYEELAEILRCKKHTLYTWLGSYKLTKYDRYDDYYGDNRCKHSIAMTKEFITDFQSFLKLRPIESYYHRFCRFADDINKKPYRHEC